MELKKFPPIELSDENLDKKNTFSALIDTFKSEKELPEMARIHSETDPTNSHSLKVGTPISTGSRKNADFFELSTEELTSKD